MDDECEHGSLRASCPVCLAPASRAPARRVSGVFDASWHGWCRWCRSDIRPGEPIVRFDDGTYRHDECVP